MDSNDLLPLLTGEGTFQKRNIFLQQAGSQCEVMIRKKTYKLIMQSDQKRTYFRPTKLFNLKDDPHEDINLLEQPKYWPISQSLLSEYKDVVESKRPTVSGKL